MKKKLSTIQFIGDLAVAVVAALVFTGAVRFGIGNRPQSSELLIHSLSAEEAAALNIGVSNFWFWISGIASVALGVIIVILAMRGMETVIAEQYFKRSLAKELRRQEAAAAAAENDQSDD